MATGSFHYEHLLPPSYKEDIKRWLAEDCPSFDYAGYVIGDAPAEARLLGKDPVRRPIPSAGQQLDRQIHETQSTH